MLKPIKLYDLMYCAKAPTASASSSSPIASGGRVSRLVYSFEEISEIIFFSWPGRMSLGGSPVPAQRRKPPIPLSGSAYMTFPPRIQL